VREHFVHFIGIIKEELDGQNYAWRIYKFPRAVRYCRRARRVMVSVFLSASSGEIGS
jgi:hypothetical protein